MSSTLRKRAIKALLYLFACVYLSHPRPSIALMGSIGVETGYDSNPGLVSSGEKGSGFSTLSLEVIQGMTPADHILVTFGVDAHGKRYFRGDDDTHLGTHLELRYINEEGTFQPAIYLAGSRIRSDVIPEDDRNVGTVGISIQLFPTLDLGIECGGSIDWLDFRRPSSPLGSRTVPGTPGGIEDLGAMMGGLGMASTMKSIAAKSPKAPMEPIGQHHHMNGPATMPLHQQGMRPDMPFGDVILKKSKPRDDRFENLYLSIQKDLFSNLTLTLSASRERLFSSLKYESFTRLGFGASLGVSFPYSIDLVTAAYWKRARYRKTALGNRTDYFRDLSISLIKSFKKFGVSSTFEHMENDSSLEFEDFYNNQISITLRYYF